MPSKKKQPPICLVDVFVKGDHAIARRNVTDAELSELQSEGYRRTTRVDSAYFIEWYLNSKSNDIRENRKMMLGKG